MMLDMQRLEIWALGRAQQIICREGARVIDAAQWLDIKRTKASRYELRSVIAASLVEALQMHAEEVYNITSFE